MKLRNLILTVLAVTAVFMACKKEKPVFGVSADKTAVELTENGGTVAVQITTAQDWKVRISSNGSWISADKESGSRSATINFTAQANDGKDRKTVVTIISGMAMERITFTQAGALKPGDGLTPETAFSASEANAWIKANLADKEISSQKYYIKGKIHKIASDGTYAASGTYGNATFYISDDGTASNDDFEAYRILYLEGKKWTSGNPDIAVGDEVMIYGYVTLYGSTAETSNKDAAGKTDSAYLYSLNSSGEGGGGESGGDDDYSQAEEKTVAEFIAAANKTTYYKLTGTVSNFNKTYCSFDLTDATGTIYVYSVLDAYKTEWASKIKNGGTIVIAGKYDYYAKNEKHEVVEAAILSFEEGGGEQTDYSQAEPKTVAEFIAAANKTTYYKLTGKVSNFNASYCSFDLTDDSGSIYVYSVLDAYKTEWASKIKNGGTIVIAGKYDYYAKNQKHEVVEAAILSFEPGEGGGGEQTDYSQAEEKTVSEFIALADPDTYYKLTGLVSNFNASYCSFDLTDVTGASIYVYSVLAEYKSEWKTKIKNGGTITIAGKYSYYEKNQQHEVIDAAILSFEPGEGGGGDDPVSGLTLTFPDENSANNQVSAYECEWTAMIGNYSWTIVNANNNKWNNDWTFIRMGRKNNPSVAAITLDQPLSNAIKRVIVTFSKVNAADKINSSKLYVASDGGFTTDVQEIDVTVTAAGDVDFVVPTPKANSYYMLVFNFAEHTANGIVEVSKVVYSEE